MQFPTTLFATLFLASTSLALPTTTVSERAVPAFSCPLNPNGPLFLGGCCDPSKFNTERGNQISGCSLATRSFDGKGFEVFTCDKAQPEETQVECCHTIVYGGGPGNPPAKGLLVCEQTAIVKS